MNKFCRPPNNKEIQALRDIAKFFSVKLVVIYHSRNSEICDVCFEKDIITLRIGYSLSLAKVYSCFFHELAHTYNKYNNKFPYYHKYNPHFFNQKEWANYFRTMKRAELYTEKVGEKLMNLFFPTIPFHYEYSKNNPDTDWQMIQQKKDIIEFYGLNNKISKD